MHCHCCCRQAAAAPSCCSHLSICHAGLARFQVLCAASAGPGDMAMPQCSAILGALRAHASPCSGRQQPWQSCQMGLMQRCRTAHHDHAFVVLSQRLHSTDEDEEALHDPTLVGRQRVVDVGPGGGWRHFGVPSNLWTGLPCKGPETSGMQVENPVAPLGNAFAAQH